MADPSDSTNKSVIPTACLQCGAPVAQASRMRREYCSDACKAERKRRLRKERPQPICTMCGGAFQRTSNRQKACSDCRDQKTKAYTRAYNTENADVVRKKRREDMAAARLANPEVFRDRNRAWWARNAEAIKARRTSDEARGKNNAYMRRRYREDPRFAVHARMASAVHQALRERKAGRKWETLVGYTVDDLVTHLERQFLPGMSWDNMGDWHIDHILAKSSFAYENDDDPEFRACWALSNLRPLWSGENQKKHAKRLFLL